MDRMFDDTGIRSYTGKKIKQVDEGGVVFEDDRRAVFVPMPVAGHWLKQNWGRYFELRKLGKIPRIPGM